MGNAGWWGLVRPRPPLLFFYGRFFRSKFLLLSPEHVLHSAIFALTVFNHSEGSNNAVFICSAVHSFGLSLRDGTFLPLNTAR